MQVAGRQGEGKGEDRGRRAARALLGALVLAVGLAGAQPARAADADGDGLDDAVDNCRMAANASQADADADGFGDACDCDFDGDGACSLGDFNLFLPDFASGVDSGLGTDMDGDGGVGIGDFSLFLAGFSSGVPGPGAAGGSGGTAVDALFAGVQCSDASPAALCQVQLAPGLLLEALRSQIALTATGDGLHLTGDLEIPGPDGTLFLLSADVTVVAGPGPFGFDTVRGTAMLTNDLGGRLAGIPLDLVHVDLGFDLGVNIQAEIPLQPDLHYMLFMASAGLSIDLGPFAIQGPGGATTVLFNPNDPFFYVGAEVANIPIPTPYGPFVFSAAAGLGISEQGLIPFRPATTAGIAALFPNFDGHLVQRAGGALPTCLGCPTLAADGYAITDLDPMDDGLALFGDDPATGGDVQLGVNGTVSVTGTLGLLSVSMDLFDATGGFTVLGGQVSTFAGGKVQSRPDLFELDAPTAFTLTPGVGEEIGVGVMIGSDPDSSFFRFESRKLTVGTQGVAASTGVGVSPFQSEDFYFQTGGQGMFLGGSTLATDIVNGVTALQETGFELRFPKGADSELILRSRFQLGQEQLRQSTMWIGPARIAQEGLYDMPTHTFRLYGEITPAGPLLEGSLTLPIPYDYPSITLILDVANRIQQQEAAVASLQQQAAKARAAVQSAQSTYNQQVQVVQDAQNIVTYWQGQLRDVDDEIADARAINCGCSSCAWYDVPCLTVCGACETAKFAEIEYWELQRGPIARSLDLARTALLAAQGLLSTYQLALSGAENTLQLVQNNLDDALLALANLYQERDALPTQAGVVDATVTLVLTDTDLTGSVGGSFQGTPIGTGVVYTGANPRACFVPPVPGATQEFCTPL